MKDPRRLIEHGATDEELALLRAADTDEPSDDAQMHLAALLGVSTHLAAPLAAASAAKVAAASLPAAASKLGAKWLVLALAGLGGAVLLGRVLTGGEDDRAPAVTRPMRSPAPVTTVATGAAVEGTATPTPADTEAVAIAGVAPEPRSSQLAASAPPKASKSIAEEIALLDRARGHLGASEPARALSALGEYDRAHRGGVLRQEAQLLRIEALWKSGDAAGARRLASRFLERNPGSPHEQRIRSLVGGSL